MLTKLIMYRVKFSLPEGRRELLETRGLGIVVYKKHIL
jgi:hypothetical protein